MNKLTQRTRFALPLACLGLIILSLHFSALLSSRLGSSFHVDGAYQTAASLSRLCALYMPGRDFDIYLGFGPIITLLPFHVLGGCSFGSSLYASHLAVSVAFTFALFCSAWWTCKLAGVERSQRAWLGVFTVSAAFLLLSVEAPGDLLLYLREMAYPGNSVLMLRYVGVFIAASLCAAFYGSARRAAIWGSAAGTSLFWSLDTGIPSAFAITLVWMIVGARSLGWKAHAVFFVAAMAAAFLFLFLASSGDIPSFVEFRSSVADGQFWYFHGFEDGDRYFSIKQTVQYFVRQSPTLSLILITTPLLAAALLAKARSSNAAVAMFIITAGCFLAGALSEFGGHIADRYYSATILVWPFAFLSAVFAWAPYRETASSRLVAPISAMAAGWLLLSAAMPNELWRVAQARPWVPEIATTLPVEDMPDVQIARNIRDEGRSILSTYYNLIDLIAGGEQKTRVDSIIHAFGEEKANWVRLATSSEPDTIITTRPAYSLWQNWLVQANWPFFRSVLLNYEPVVAGNSITRWDRRASPLTAGRELSCKVDQTEPYALAISITGATSLAIVDVTLNLDISVVSSWLPINGSRALLVVETPSIRNSPKTTGIEPRNGASAFPVVLVDGAASSRIRIAPSNRGAISASGCVARVVSNVEHEISALVDWQD